MKPKEIHDRLANRSLAELDAVWRELAAGVKAGSGAFAFRYDRQHASRAAKWLPMALGSDDATKTPLSAIARLDPQETGSRARAAFLEVMHGIATEKGDTGPVALPSNVRKAANNVSESVRRAIRFFRALIPEEDLPEETLWPAPPKVPGHERGIRLYRDIRKGHLREGILDPAKQVFTITERVANEHAEQGRRAGSYGAYNMMIRDLRQMLAGGVLPGVPASLADGLVERRLNPSVGPRRILAIADLATRWPRHFRLTPSGGIDETYGIAASRPSCSLSDCFSTGPSSSGTCRLTASTTPRSSKRSQTSSC